jgi:cyanophycinase
MAGSKLTCGWLHLGFAPLLLAGLEMLALVPVQGQVGGPVKPRIDPAGIEGTLLLCGKDIPPPAVERFVNLAGGKDKKARLVVVRYVAMGKAPLADGNPEQSLKSEPFKERIMSLTTIHIEGIGKIDKAEDVDALNQATGIWLAGNDPVRVVPLQPDAPDLKACTNLLKKGGVVAGSELAALALGNIRVNEFSANGVSPGLGLLQDSLIGFRAANPKGNLSVAGLLGFHRAYVGYELDHDSALLLQGRKMLALGTGTVTIHLAAGSMKAKRQIVLHGKENLADLTALRNAALARLQHPPFPPKKLDPPEVKKGTLVIVGGGGLPKGLVEKFVELAGGDKAVIVVLPTAVPDPLPLKDAMAEAFEKAGAKKVTVLKARKLKDVESKESLDILAEATGIWFGGGRQWGFVDAYAGTKAEPLMHEVLARGGVIGGSSAGASIQGEYMPRGDPLGNLNIIAEGYEMGLGFLKGVAIDQHFSQRKRHADMTLLMKTYPQFLGIGLDETTAIIVKGHIAEVTGKGKVFFYDTNRAVAPGQPDYEAVADEGRYDLKARKVLNKGLVQSQ